MPEAREYAERNESVGKWLQGQLVRAIGGFREGHEPTFERGLDAFVEGWERVNELIANEYSVPLDDPKCDWRYWRWKRTFHSVELETPYGGLTVYRVRPYPEPEGNWLTMEVAIDAAINPITKAVLEVFGTLPVMGHKLEKPAKGENHLHIFVGKEMRMETDFG